METTLAQQVVRDGRTLTIRRVAGPDAQWAPRILPFLAHKGGIWQWQLDHLTTADLTPLRFNGYLGEMEGQLVGHICTVEHCNVGLFGHVYTHPQFRGLSIARLLTEAVVADVDARGGLALWLVTEFDSTAYRAYRQFGFESIAPGEGLMARMAPAAPAELARRFAQGQPTQVRPLHWGDYASLNALTICPDGPPLRSRLLQVLGRNIVEATLLPLLQAVEKGEPVQALVLTAGEDWPVGLAICRETPGRFAPHREPAPPVTLDLYTHPNFEGDYRKLLAAVSLPPGRKVIAEIDSHSPARQQALAEWAFAPEGRLTATFNWQGRPTDLLYLARNPR